MKNFKSYFCLIAICTLLFSSCSKEEQNVMDDASSKATVSFGAVLNDLVQNKEALKQQMDMPACSDDVPAYVDVVLTGTTNVGSMSAPLRVSVNPNPGDFDGDGVNEYFTDEHSSLELEAGPYSLEWFVVRNANLDVIWVAPVTGGSMAGWVDSPLPIDFNLGDGVKKYVDVPVLCFDDRDVNEYGYLFFDIESHEAFEFCFFANFCDENGRHFPAAYSVNVWVGQDNTGDVLYAGETNTVGMNDAGDYFASPLCLALPNLAQYGDDENYLYYEVTIEDWDGAYGDVAQTVHSGHLSRSDIEANFNGADGVDYEHLRFGCGDDDDGDGNGNGQDGDQDNDGVVDGEDNCPSTPAGVDVYETGENAGCPIDGDEDGTPDYVDECPNEAGPADNSGCPEDGEEPEACEMEAADANCGVGYLEGENGWIEINDPDGFPDPLYIFEPNGEDPWASTAIVLDEGNPVVLISSASGYILDDYIIEVSDGNDGLADACVSGENIARPEGDDPDVIAQFTASFSYPFYVRIEANVCPE